MKLTSPTRFWTATTAALLLACAAHSADPVGKELFNGKDLQGWVPVHDVSFDVHEGNLRLNKGMGWLRTEKEYQDFVLELEWKALVDKYDSGIFVRCGAEGKPWPTDGWQVNLRYDALGGLVKGYKPIVPAESPKLPVDKWIKVRIEVKGKKITLDMDGERSWEYEGLDREKGYIGFQAEDRAFEFRNIRIQTTEAK